MLIFVEVAMELTVLLVNLSLDNYHHVIKPVLLFILSVILEVLAKRSVQKIMTSPLQDGLIRLNQSKFQLEWKLPFTIRKISKERKQLSLKLNNVPICNTISWRFKTCQRRIWRDRTKVLKFQKNDRIVEYAFK